MDKNALLDTLDRVQESIRAADQKAGILLTTIGVLLAFPTPTLLVAERAANAPPLPLAAVLLAIGALVSYIVSLISCFLVLFPRTDNISHTFSLIYWGNVGSLDLNAYIDRAKAQTETGYLEDLACQVHVNAVIANRKHCHFKMAVRALALGIALLIVCYGVIAWL
ncbi:MAG TPA: Pycsar system effector family protein [Vicinamibacterales bacterium]|nr:Pycsar system effector family protein [Vicinamibacterales bacterium]HWI18877.1 Pycsar system effector family protein [Vicinamibacterales bacterium]